MTQCDSKHADKTQVILKMSPLSCFMFMFHLSQILLLLKHIQNILPILIGFTPPANSLQIAAGWKESHFYSLAFGQSVASMY